MRNNFFLLISLFSALNVFAENGELNPVIGNQGFEIVNGRMPNSNDSEADKVQSHLLYATYYLANQPTAHLSYTQKKNRNRIIQLLLNYALRGEYPKNYDFNNQRKPCFIDKDGTHCAVGYLIKETESQEVAENINEKFKYATIAEMDADLLTEWANENGITLKECALIQPTYSYLPVRPHKLFTFSVGAAYRFEPSFYDIYTQIELRYYFNRVFKWPLRYMNVYAQYHALGANQNSLTAGFNRRLFAKKNLRWEVGAGVDHFWFNERTGWNFVPRTALLYSKTKNLFVFNFGIEYAYFAGLSNQENYTLNRNQLTFKLGLGRYF